MDVCWLSRGPLRELTIFSLSVVFVGSSNMVKTKVTRARCKNVAVPQHRLLNLFSDHVPLDSCSPKHLFALSKPLDKNGWTSSWPDVKKMAPFLSDLLTESFGRNIKFKCFHTALDAWLKSREKHWSVADIDVPTRNVRGVVSTLQAMKRIGRRPPRNYDHLSDMIDMTDPFDSKVTSFYIRIHQNHLNHKTSTQLILQMVISSEIWMT